VGVSNFSDLKAHMEHALVITNYHDQNIAIECMTCHAVLIDFDAHEEEEENPLWEDDALQFARLLCELAAVGVPDGADWASLSENMDLSVVELDSLFDRARRRWEEAKERIPTARQREFEETPYEEADRLTDTGEDNG
jgi:hypothetical protein